MRLNLRLAPDIYLGVTPVTKYRGRFHMEGSSGEIVEYAVKMRRIDRNRILKELIKTDSADAGTILRVSERLASFHRRGRLAGSGYPPLAPLK